MLLVSYHAKEPDVCKWVIEMFGNQETENETVRQWIQACKDNLAQLESLSDGSEIGSTSAEYATGDSRLVAK